VIIFIHYTDTVGLNCECRDFIAIESCVIMIQCYVVMHLSQGDCFLLNYRGSDKSLVRPTSRCILFDGENISFDASLVIYIYI